MAHTKNGKLIGQAAHSERREQAEYIADMQDAERARRKAERDYCQNLVQEIMDIIGDGEAYWDWLDGTPNDNAGFLAAVKAKHAEIQPCTCSPNDRVPACPSCRSRNASMEIPF